MFIFTCYGKVGVSESLIPYTNLRGGYDYRTLYTTHEPGLGVIRHSRGIRKVDTVETTLQSSLPRPTSTDVGLRTP